MSNNTMAGDREAAGAIEQMVETYGVRLDPVAECPASPPEPSGFLTPSEVRGLARVADFLEEDKLPACAALVRSVLLRRRLPGVPLDLLVTDPTELD